MTILMQVLRATRCGRSQKPTALTCITEPFNTEATPLRRPDASPVARKPKNRRGLPRHRGTLVVAMTQHRLLGWSPASMPPVRRGPHRTPHSRLGAPSRHPRPTSVRTKSHLGESDRRETAPHSQATFVRAARRLDERRSCEWRHKGQWPKRALLWEPPRQPDCA